MYGIQSAGMPAREKCTQVWQVLWVESMAVGK